MAFNRAFPAMTAKSVQDLQELGVAARRHMLSGAGTRAYLPTWVPAGALRRAGAASVDVFLVLLTGCFSGILALSDFDGHPRQNAIGGWGLFAWLAALGLVYTAVEGLGRPTVGKWCLGLRLHPAEAADAGTGAATRDWRRRTLSRWLLKSVPLLACTTVFTTGLCRTVAQTHDQYLLDGWDPDLGLLAALLALPLLLGAYLPCAAAPAHRSLYDRASGVIVVRPEWVLTQRGFDVILTPAPRPVLPDATRDPGAG